MNSKIQELTQTETHFIAGGNSTSAFTSNKLPAALLLYVPKNFQEATRLTADNPQLPVTQATYETGGGFEFIA